ncbi:hypothetical protein [Holdemanella biformis]|uniref:hypothetical protein n=1 Tax=Holdemanella biformis TaxID=1735 RepID=UPI0022E938B8|nr:hypothetical protein [Holdemanella biformis]
MNADEMMYELGFEKVEKHCKEVEVMYQSVTENECWAVVFFKSYGTEIMNYSVSHYLWFETDEDWKKMDPIVDMDLHKAIHQVLLEHGWL